MADRLAGEFGPERYPVVLFDFDGTLVDTGLAVRRTVMRVMAAHGVRVDDPDELNVMIGPPLADGFMQAFGVGRAQAEAYTAEYRERFAREVTPEDYPALPGVPELLRGLAGQGRRLGVATSRMQDSAETMLANLGMRSHFEVVAGRDDRTRRTKADSIRFALAQLDAVPEQALMVGDRFHDVEGAHEVGMACVGVYTGAAAPGEHDDAEAACVDLYEVATLLGLTR